MARIVDQMKIQVADGVGKLAQITEALKAERVNVVAACAWTMEGKGHMLLVTSDIAKACSALADKVETCDQGQAVAVNVADDVGALHDVARKLADGGVNINMCYATTAGVGEAMIILDTADNEKAASLV